MADKHQITGTQIAMGAVGALVGMGLFNLVKGTAFEGLLLWAVGLLIVLAIIVAFVFLSKNRGSVEVASPELTQHARTFQPETGKGVIYVLRNQYSGMLMGLEVRLNGKVIGETRGYSFYRLVVEPGTHQLSGTEKCPAALEVSVGAGQIAFVEQFISNNAKVVGQYGYEWSADIAAAQQKILKTKMFLPKTA